MKKKLSTLLFFSITIIAANAQSWLLKGNGGTNQAKNFIGTTDAKPLAFKTNGIERMKISKNGNIGIGTSSPGARFNVMVGNSVTLSATDSFLLGPITAGNLAFDNNEIQARNNGSGSTLYLNFWGGDVWIGNRHGSAVPAVYTSPTGQVGIGSNVNQAGYALTVNPFA